TDSLGVNESSASFVASFGTTAGMQGCAGVFPALLVVYVSNVNGLPIDISLIIMSVIVISIGSLGIAGIPGTATMAASVALSGTGLGDHYQTISPILAIDPLIDMGRTLINVTGGLTNAMVVDKQLKQMDMEAYKSDIVVDRDNLL
ncbi:MAG: cation:dicarboxylate symporter family transporter, partial [Bacilli bacterium]